MSASEPHNLIGITIPPGQDIRLEAINLLTAIFEHDPYLFPAERSEIESVIGSLDAARDREVAHLTKEPDKDRPYQTGIMDPVIPATWRRET